MEADESMVVGLVVNGLAVGTDDRPKLQDENIEAILSRTGGDGFGGEELPALVLDSPTSSGKECAAGGDDEDVLASLTPSVLPA